MKTPKYLANLSKLAESLPEDLASDWDGTNHYELSDTSPGEDDGPYYWMILTPMVEEVEDPCNSVFGRRVGLLMDIAAEVSALKKAGRI